jgi:hypothetical protein
LGLTKNALSEGLGELGDARLLSLCVCVHVDPKPIHAHETAYFSQPVGAAADLEAGDKLYQSFVIQRAAAAGVDDLQAEPLDRLV